MCNSFFKREIYTSVKWVQVVYRYSDMCIVYVYCVKHMLSLLGLEIRASLCFVVCMASLCEADLEWAALSGEWGVPTR